MRKELPHLKVIKKNVFDPTEIRKDFPILNQRINGKPLVYLDNAATSQKPIYVIEAMNRYYMEENSNIHRGVHYLSELATQSYEAARIKIQRYINAKHREEIIFTRGTTESINLVAYSYGKHILKEDDEIIISAMEHHSNIVPWQLIRDEKKILLRVIPINDKGELFIDKYEKMFNEKTKLVSIVHISNVLGTINPIKQMIEIAHRYGVPVLIDGAQGIPHTNVDVQDLDCDFYAFSGHKMYGPTGIGVLYGKKELLDSMPPFQGGGDMIKSVSFEKTIYNELPYKFEAGTPNIAGGVGLGATIDYLSNMPFKEAHEYEHKLLNYAHEKISSIKGVRIVGTAKQKSSVLSFVIEDIHPHDIGTILDDDGIAIRTGHHCAQPLMKCFNVPATARASFAFYNTEEEVDRLVNGIHKAIKIFS